MDDFWDNFRWKIATWSFMIGSTKRFLPETDVCTDVCCCTQMPAVTWFFFGSGKSQKRWSHEAGFVMVLSCFCHVVCVFVAWSATWCVFVLLGILPFWGVKRDSETSSFSLLERRAPERRPCHLSHLDRAGADAFARTKYRRMFFIRRKTERGLSQGRIWGCTPGSRA